MPTPESIRRQHALGGTAGVLLLGFALVYHFFPRWLSVDQNAPARNSLTVTHSQAPIGFDQRPQAQKPSAVDAGPPISLAPEAVIAAQHRSRNAPAVETDPALLALLGQARAAQKAGRLVEPADTSALTYYQKILDVDADNAAARAGLQDLRSRLGLAVERALAEGDADRADDALDKLAQVPGSQAQVQSVKDRVDVLQQARPLLAHAADLLKQGKATAPADDNALAVYRKVLEVDPDNAVARQGLEQIQRGVLDQALAAGAQNDFADADAALDHAASILPGTQSLQDTRSRIEGLRRRQANNLLNQARTALDAGNLQLAQSLAQRALSVSADVAGIDVFNEHLRNARLYANFKPGQVFSDRFLDRAGRAPAMVVVPTGSFMMGSPGSEPGHRSSESPQHEVDIEQGFAIGRSEVSVAQFRDFVRATGYVTDAERLGGASVYDESSGRLHDSPRATWKDDYAGQPARDSYPVLNVSWNDAQAYAEWLSQRTGKRYQLPSEAQFEYAERGGTRTPYWWGDGSPGRRVENLTGAGDRSPSKRTWTNAFVGYRDGFWGPAPVRSFEPNPFGLYDIGGNVSEWVQDCWHDNYTRAPRDGSAWINPGCTRRVVRGGSWGSAPDQVRSAYRIYADADTRSGRVGFRVAREL